MLPGRVVPENRDQGVRDPHRPEHPEAVEQAWYVVGEPVAVRTPCQAAQPSCSVRISGRIPRRRGLGEVLHPDPDAVVAEIVDREDPGNAQAVGKVTRERRGVDVRLRPPREPLDRRLPVFCGEHSDQRPVTHRVDRLDEDPDVGSVEPGGGDPVERLRRGCEHRICVGGDDPGRDLSGRVGDRQDAGDVPRSEDAGGGWIGHVLLPRDAGAAVSPLRRGRAVPAS